MWVVLYWEGGARKYNTLGLFSKMSKGDAQGKQAEFMKEVNARQANSPDPDITFGDFLDGVALPFYRSKWKRSTASTTENRITHHLAVFRETKLQAVTLKTLQAFLAGKAQELSRSMAAHIRWDLRSMFRLALAEGFTQRDPTVALYTPKEATVTPTRAMTGKEAEQYVNALDLRERAIAYLAIFAGMRPGEIPGLQRRHVSSDCRKAVIEQRLYRGDIDTPKTTVLTRKSQPTSAGTVSGLRWVSIRSPPSPSGLMRQNGSKTPCSPLNGVKWSGRSCWTRPSY
jgi:hypothetical protein